MSVSFQKERSKGRKIVCRGRKGCKISDLKNSRLSHSNKMPAQSKINQAKDEGRGFKSSMDYYDYDFPSKSDNSLTKKAGNAAAGGASFNPFSGLLASASQSVGSLSNLYGSYSGHGYATKKEDCEGISLALLLTTFLGIGVLFFTLFTKITMGRKKRSVTEEVAEEMDPVSAVLDNLHEIVYSGIKTSQRVENA